ncbi:MAG: hypothetical protein JNJ83_02065 [Verrucomicrobiaceae bacterium]|nr:hypothetical protein [Verrucomicrobiaceae bacterium]
MNRRRFVATSTALAVSSAIADSSLQSPTLIDCNSYIGHWPFRALPSPALVGCSERWISSFEAIFHNDLSAANARTGLIARESNAKLRAVGEINLSLPAWRDDLERCVRDHAMRVLRVHPNYHSWSLASPEFVKLLQLVDDERLVLQIVAQMEDERTQPSLMEVAPVDLKPLGEALTKIPGARVMVLNTNVAQISTSLRGTAVTLDTGMIEGVGGLENLLSSWPVEQVAFGSFTPLFYWESNYLKLKESLLSANQLDRITTKNALMLVDA